MLGKCINCTSKKIVATTLALTLTFSSFATLSSPLRASAKGESSVATTSDSSIDSLESARNRRKDTIDNYLEAIKQKRIRRKVALREKERRSELRERYASRRLLDDS